MPKVRVGNIDIYYEVHGEGDALDSVIATFAVPQALAKPDFEMVAKNPVYLKEGYVY